MPTPSRHKRASNPKLKPAKKKSSPAKADASISNEHLPALGSGSGIGRTKRAGFLTVRERKQLLSELPSLNAPLPLDPSTEPHVEPEIPPPEAPTAPPDPNEAPGPQTYTDHGMPIPDHYGTDSVVAVARDPNWIFVHWELKGGNLDRLCFKYSSEVIEQARWVLRIRAVHTRKTQIADVDLRKGQWYLWAAPNARYVVELGFITPEGEFVGVCKSDEVTTPSAGISTLTDENWMIVKKELEELLDVSGADSAAPGTDEDRGRSAPLQRVPMPRARAFFSGLLFKSSLIQSPGKNSRHDDETGTDAT